MPMGERFTREGEGWRLGWDAAATCYKGLVAGPNWAVELTETEFHTLCRLITEIGQTLTAIAAELMEEERIACEAEAEDLWLEAEGLPGAYQLRFILATGRRCEGAWDVAATQELTQAVQHLTGF